MSPVTWARSPGSRAISPVSQQGAVCIIKPSYHHTPNTHHYFQFSKSVSIHRGHTMVFTHGERSRARDKGKKTCLVSPVYFTFCTNYNCYCRVVSEVDRIMYKMKKPQEDLFEYELSEVNCWCDLRATRSIQLKDLEPYFGCPIEREV